MTKLNNGKSWRIEDDERGRTTFFFFTWYKFKGLPIMRRKQIMIETRSNEIKSLNSCETTLFQNKLNNFQNWVDNYM